MRRSRKARLGGVGLRVVRTKWSLHIGQPVSETRRFTSLSQMAASLSSNPVQDDEWVTLVRNGVVIHRGLWGGGCAQR